MLAVNLGSGNHHSMPMMGLVILSQRMFHLSIFRLISNQTEIITIFTREIKMKNQHETKWTVVYKSGAVRTFSAREDAVSECLMYDAFKIVPPLYA